MPGLQLLGTDLITGREVYGDGFFYWYDRRDRLDGLDTPTLRMTAGLEPPAFPALELGQELKVYLDGLAAGLLRVLAKVLMEEGELDFERAYCLASSNMLVHRLFHAEPSVGLAMARFYMFRACLWAWNSLAKSINPN